MRAWVVEDNEQNFELVEFLLAESGWEVSRAQTGAELRKLLAATTTAHAPEVVLLDMNLPDASGLELLADLRSRRDLASICVVAVTAHAMRGDRERCLAAGCDGYLSKPIEPASFAQEIASAVGAKRGLRGAGGPS